MTLPDSGDTNTHDEELLADLFDSMLQEILDGNTPDLEEIHRDRPELRERIKKTWQLACSVAGRREPSRPVLGGYEIVRELGHGGMGTVYLARHQSLQRDVAIKVLPHSLALSAMAKQRFLEEARALARIRHENVVHIHRIIDHAEMLAFEMEYIDGPSLQSLILQLRQRPKPFAMTTLVEVLGHEVSPGVRSSVEWFVRLGIRIARSLGEVHRHGLVHRDVKPSNILLRADGTPVLADFGLALHGDISANRSKFAGTPVYAAPERLRGGDVVIDARTDVYSLGVTLYEALTSSPPFSGNSTHDVLRRIENGNVPGLRQRAPHVSRDLATVIGKAMEPDPRHRYATADEFADDLERLLSLQPIHARPAGPLRSAFQFLRRHQRVVLAAAASAVLATVVIWPLAAHANARSDARARAAEILLTARSQLLTPETLPTDWTGTDAQGHTLLRASAATARAAAFQAAVQHYDAALAITPDDVRLRRERDVVHAAASIDAATATSTLAASPLLRTLLHNAATHRRLGDGVAPLLGPSSTDDRFAGGLLAFLLGDYEASANCWNGLPPALHDDPLVDACTALQVADQGAPELAYPRLFHASRAFPASRALGFALADAALATGDVPLARQWIADLPASTGAAIDARRELLAADLLAAEGRHDDAQQRYRALAAADATDPTPLLRLANLALRNGQRVGGERLLRHVLQRWPNVASARLQLARLALQSRDVPAYLAHVRYAFSRLRHQASPQTADLFGILRLGGLRDLHAEASARLAFSPLDVRRDDAIPLAAWLRPEQVQGIEQATRLLAILDDAAAQAAAIDPRPVGVALRSSGSLLLQVPQLTVRMPWPSQAIAAAGIPLLLGTPTDLVTRELLPFQTSLGTRLHMIADRRLFITMPPEGVAIYGNHIVRTADLDGDTLPELCFSLPPDVGGPHGGCIEIRSDNDGTLLRTWDSHDDAAMFARSLVSLGDIDGDLCDDLLIGCPLRTNDPAAVAAVEAWSGRTGRVLWRVEETTPSFGATLAALDDVDDDGCADVVVGCPPMQVTGDARGRAFVLSGRNGTKLQMLLADRGGVWFGAAVANAGDVTGDGIGDVLVGGNFGRAPGLVAVFDATTGAMVTSFSEPDHDANYGNVVAGGGDLDDDGIAEIVVGAPGAGGKPQPGRVLVLSCRTGRSLYELTGERPREGFGTAIQVLPDWRRDRRPALAVASLRGGPIGNGYLRVFELDTGAPLQTFAGNQGHRIFTYTLCDLGDRNGDGLRELGSLGLRADGRSELWTLSFADATPPAAEPANQRR